MRPSQAFDIATGPRIDRLVYSVGTPRKKPKAGDRRTTKRHGEQVRVHVKHNGYVVVSGSRYVYEWVSIHDERAKP